MDLFYHQVEGNGEEDAVDCVTDAFVEDGMIVIKQKWSEHIETPQDEGRAFLSVDDLLDMVDALSNYAKRLEDGQPG